MGIIVSKFGGSSTASAPMLRQVSRILRADPRRRCAVVSAPGGVPRVTDLLAACAGAKASEATFDAVTSRFAEIAAGLGLPDPTRTVREALETALAVSPDMLLSRGEALCAGLLARYMGWPWLDAADAVRFDGDGRPDVPATYSAIRSAAQAHDHFILPGFYGSDLMNRVRTLPRNGSDITGALAAAALRAEVYENWTDVPGLMTADPSLVPEALPISRVGCAQMAALAEAGAKVLHPDCLAPVRDAGIPTHLMCTARPDAPGTWVEARYVPVVPCVAGKVLPDEGDALALVTVFGADAAMKPRLVQALSGALVREDDRVHVFLTRPGNLAEDVRAAHRVLYP